MKYIIDVPNSYVDITNGLYIPTDKLGNSRIDTGLKVTRYTEPDRKTIEDEVWEFARRIICPSDCCEDSISAHTKEIFNKEGWEIRGIFNGLSYQEAKSKYDAWKEQKDGIHIGDEVEYEWFGKIRRFIVIGIMDDKAYGFRLLDNNDDYDDAGDFCDIDELKKTGRKFPEIDELLKKIKENL